MGYLGLKQASCKTVTLQEPVYVKRYPIAMHACNYYLDMQDMRRGVIVSHQ